MEQLTPYQKVKAFHEKFGLYIGNGSNIPQDEYNLGVKLIVEELLELNDNLAYNRNKLRPNDPTELVDAIIDSIFVLYGLLVRMGLDGDKLFDIVWKANMAKEGGTKREDGKLLKPDNWKPPQGEIESYLKETGMLP